MMRSRCRLHKTKLCYFVTYLKGLGWQEAKLTSCWEVLRMKHPKYKGVLLVYDRIEAKEHFTTHGIAEELLSQWLREMKTTRQGNG